MSQTTNYCPRHPKNETNLRCGRCEKLVCTECMVHTPVGVRCQDCGKLRRLPTYDVTASFLARGIVAGLLLANVAVPVRKELEDSTYKKMNETCRVTRFDRLHWLCIQFMIRQDRFVDHE